MFGYHVSTTDFWLKIVVAVVCGTVLGLERQIRGKPVGIRTSVLICLATTTFVMLARLLDQDPESAVRILGQLITGVGFLGAGVMIAREGLVLGVTSAAVIWILAAVGSAIGSGYYDIGLIVTFVAAATLIGVERLETGFRVLRTGVHAKSKQHQQTSKGHVI